MGEETGLFAIRRVSCSYGNSRRILELCAGWSWDPFPIYWVLLSEAWNTGAGTDSFPKD